MNAPAQFHGLELELIPLKSICVSETQAQAERRGRYDAAALDELADSIKADGLVQPIVVRPLQALRGLAKYELVAGERRWLATERAGQEHILARIVPLTDEQVLKAQMVENLHREGLHPLAEAKGYRELIDGGVKAEAIGDLIGKSRSYVYARVKLLELTAPVQEALDKGEISADQALLFARIPTPKLQELGLKQLRNWAYQGHGERLSFRRTAEILRDKGKGMLIPLAQVPFRLDDTYWAFGPKQGRLQAQDAIELPTCLACPKRSGNDPELLAALEDPNVCTDKECHDAKAKQEFERRRERAKVAGQEILVGDAAAAIMPTNFGTRGYIDLDETCDDDRFPEEEPEQGKDESDEAFEQRYTDWHQRAELYQSRTYRQILGDAVAGLDIQLVQDPRHKAKLRELAPDKAVAKLLAEKGIKARFTRDTRKPQKAAKPEDPEKAARQKEKEVAAQAAAELEERIESEYLERLLKLVHEKWKGPMKRDDLELVADYVIDEWEAGQIVGRLYGKRVSPASMNERDLGRLIIAVILGLAVEGSAGPRGLMAMAKRLKIDPKALEKQVRAELAPKASTVEKKPAKKKGGKKK